MQQHDSIKHLQQLMIDGGAKAFDIIPITLRNVLKKKMWVGRNDALGKPFASFEAFAVHPRWHGLETTIDDLLVYCRKHHEVASLIKAEVGGLRPSAGRPSGPTSENVRNTNIKVSTQTATYTLRRLKRDRPDLAEKVVAGEMSANKAAIAAGFRQPMIAVPADLGLAIAALFRRFGKAKVIAAVDRNRSAAA